MGSGRIIGSSPFTRTPPTKNKRRNIFIICEGATELDYFQALKDKNSYKDCVVVNPVDRIGPDRDDTDRNSMIQLAFEYQQFQKSGQLHLRLFMSMVINIFINNFKNTSEKEFGLDQKELRQYLRDNVRDAYYSSYLTSDYVSDGLVKDTRNLASEIIKDCNCELGKDLDYFTAYEDSILFPKSFMDFQCKSYVVFDRDYDELFSRGHEDFDEWLSECQRTGVEPVITSPCFELWLYMHWPDNDYGTPSFDTKYAHDIKVKVIGLENPMWSKSEIESYVNNKRDKCLYRRGCQNRFDQFYHDKIKHAIYESYAHPNLFWTDPKELKNRPGTMIGKFLEDLLR